VLVKGWLPPTAQRSRRRPPVSMPIDGCWTGRRPLGLLPPARRSRRHPQNTTRVELLGYRCQEVVIVGGNPPKPIIEVLHRLIPVIANRCRQPLSRARLRLSRPAPAVRLAADALAADATRADAMYGGLMRVQYLLHS